MSEWFHVGQKAVCIWDGDWIGGRRVAGISVPVLNGVYTIRGFIEEDGRIGLLLEEICNPPVLTISGIGEPSFYEKHFRPLRKRSTDISIFKAMLSPKKQEVGGREAPRTEAVLQSASVGRQHSAAHRQSQHQARRRFRAVL